MKVLLHGRNRDGQWGNRTRRFRCGDCGCLFDADKGEYSIGSQYNELIYTCKCPDCGAVAAEFDAQAQKNKPRMI